MKKVSLKYCDEYDLEKVESCLKEAIENLGGLSKFISKGDRVLLKVNLLMKKKPEDVTTTHPVFTKALVRILTEYGAKVLIGDSPGGPFNKTMLRSIYKASGMEEVAQQTEAVLNYNLLSFEKENPDGLLLKRLTLADMLNDVDKIISVSKLKTHGMMTFTGAVKNMFGTVPGVLKAEYHLNMSAYDDFANALIDICLCSSPVLSFMDGIIGMEGEGPSAGTPRKINAVIASESPYHLDKVAATIIGLGFSEIPTIKACIDRGIVSDGLGDIELDGDLNKFIVKDYIIPKSIDINFMDRIMPKTIKNMLNRYLRPRIVFDYDTCIGCKICADNCPAKVISMQENRPILESSGCISCFCCHELCPQKAVSIHRPRLLKILTKR